MRLLATLFLPLAVLFSDVSGFHGLFSNRIEEPAQSIGNMKYNMKSTYGLKDAWIEQRLDHFNPLDNRTWQMRYISNDEIFEVGGPIVIYIGGEWTISYGPILHSQAFQIAEQHNGYLFYTEHRFYGKSLPTDDASTKNLKYLSTDQALADLAYFIQHIKETIPDLANSQVVVVGGSYSGILATSFRLKYPHIVDVALASSAGSQAILEFKEYYENVGSSIQKYGGQKCYDIVEKAMKQLREKVQTKDGQQEIAELFHLCKPVGPDTPLDFGIFVMKISEIFAALTQLEGISLLVEDCDYLEQKFLVDSELKALAKLAKIKWGLSCSDVEYENKVKFYRKTEWTAPSTQGSLRQWLYQTCTEFGFFQTDASPNQPFGTGGNNMELRWQFCKDVFEDAFIDNARQILDTGIERTNLFYGVKNHALSKIIFTQGTLDPWHSLGVLEDINEEAKAIVITGATHCQDLQPFLPNDTDEMRQAKERVLEIISKWLK